VPPAPPGGAAGGRLRFDEPVRGRAAAVRARGGAWLGGQHRGCLLGRPDDAGVSAAAAAGPGAGAGRGGPRGPGLLRGVPVGRDAPRVPGPLGAAGRGPGRGGGAVLRRLGARGRVVAGGADAAVAPVEPGGDLGESARRARGAPAGAVGDRGGDAARRPDGGGAQLASVGRHLVVGAAFGALWKCQRFWLKLTAP